MRTYCSSSFLLITLVIAGCTEEVTPIPVQGLTSARDVQVTTVAGPHCQDVIAGGVFCPIARCPGESSPCSIGDLGETDTDCDGVANLEWYDGPADNCPQNCNPEQENVDGDARGDACDRCPGDPGNDADGDGLCAESDNCPGVANAGQADADEDGHGDACDEYPNGAPFEQALEAVAALAAIECRGTIVAPGSWGATSVAAGSGPQTRIPFPESTLAASPLTKPGAAWSLDADEVLVADAPGVYRYTLRGTLTTGLLTAGPVRVHLVAGTDLASTPDIDYDAAHTVQGLTLGAPSGFSVSGTLVIASADTELALFGGHSAGLATNLTLSDVELSLERLGLLDE